MSETLKITLVQSDIRWENPKANHDYHYSLIKDLKGKTDIIVFPEMFTTGFSLKSSVLAEHMEGRTVSWMKEVAKEMNCVISGSVIIKDDENFVNRFLWVAPDGSIEYYDKRHLFRMGHEHLYYSQGNRKVIVNYKNWKIRLLVCYDLRFPVWSRNLNDYDVAFYIANWPDSRSYAWRNLLQARATENQAYVIGVNRAGVDGKNLVYTGDSMAVHPNGKIIAEAQPSIEYVFTVEISKKELDDFKTAFPAYMDADEFEVK